MQVFCIICTELYKPCLKPSKVEDVSSDDSATLIKLKIDNNVKMHVTQNVTCATVYLREQSGIVTQNYC